jgi:putative acetyltransferase
MVALSDIRKDARAIVREFGFLQTHYEGTAATHGETHALIELKRIGELEGGELARLLNINKSGASKILSKLRKNGWIRSEGTADARKRLTRLTPAGERKVKEIEQLASTRLQRALDMLTSDEQRTLAKGVELLAKSLKRSRALDQFTIRPCEPSHNKQMAAIVRRSLKDFGFAGPGTAAADPSLDYLSSFNGRRKCYLIAEKKGKVMGGAGIIPMEGEAKTVCELVRMFIRPEARNTGLSQVLIDNALMHARKFGYKTCYLETTEQMTAAQNLYVKNGFSYVKKRRGDTGHFACTVLMEKNL